MLWDCISLLDAATIEIVKAPGGLRASAISHPHSYTTMVDWSRAFGEVVDRSATRYVAALESQEPVECSAEAITAKNRTASVSEGADR